MSAIRWALLGVVCVSAGGCSNDTADTWGQPDRVLDIVLAGEPGTLDPHKFSLMVETRVLGNLFEGLTRNGQDGQSTPGAAQSWHTSEDGRTWRFELKPGLSWSDGVSLQAEDFVFSLRRAFDPRTAAALAFQGYAIKNAEAVSLGELPPDALGVYAPSPTELVIELDRPEPYLLDLLRLPVFYPVPRHQLDAYGDRWTSPEHWVSNGEFQLANWIPNGYIELRRHTQLTDPLAINTVRFHAISSPQTALNRYRAGEVDSIPTLRADEDTLPTDYVSHIRTFQESAMQQVEFNFEHEIFADPRVREALTLVVDQSVVAHDVQRVAQTPARSMIPDYIGHTPVVLPHLALEMGARQARAQDLLRQAGFDEGNPLEFTLRYIPGRENNSFALALSGMWSQIGARVALHGSELAAFYNDLAAGDFEVGITAFVSFPFALHYIDDYAETDTTVDLSRYDNPEFNALIKRIQQTASVADRGPLINAAEQVLINDYVKIPLTFYVGKSLVNPRIEGWVDNIYDSHPVRYLRWKN